MSPNHHFLRITKVILTFIYERIQILFENSHHNIINITKWRRTKALRKRDASLESNGGDEQWRCLRVMEVMNNGGGVGKKKEDATVTRKKKEEQ